MEDDWETVNSCEMSVTQRLKVEGGFLYRTSVYYEKTLNVAMVFVPIKSSEDA